jgi:hypothetical protein
VFPIFHTKPVPGPKRIYLHIGTHKTGSTSIQAFLRANRRRLEKHGISLFNGSIDRFNHIELYLAAIRPERDSFAKQKLRIKTGPSFTAVVRGRVASFLASSRTSSVLMTTEGLSLLRHADEIERLRLLLDADHNQVSVILYLREREQFIESYKKQIFKVPGRAFSDDPASVFYVEPGTWLTDYDAIIDAFRGGFGKDAVSIIDYDAEIERRGDVLPSFVEALGLRPEMFGDIGKYRSN